MHTHRRDLLSLSAALAGSTLLAGCLGVDPDGSNGDPEDGDPDDGVDVDPDAIEELVRENVSFALSLHRTLVEDEPTANLLASPYSVAVALAMTYAGARGETESQMAEAVRFTLPQDDLHPTFAALEAALESRGEDTDTDDEDGIPFRLSLANAVWGQDGYPFREAYIDLLESHYGAGLRTVDYVNDAEAARDEINAWVTDETEDRIEDLIPEGALNRLTRLVLTNAVYFRANWASTFPEEWTHDEEFTALDGSIDVVSMMRNEDSYPYASVDGHQVVELPYVGESVGMVVLVPAEGEFESVEASLDADRLADLFDALERREGEVRLPRFGFESSFGLKDALSSLGMPDAFDEARADFGGMAHLDETGENLLVDDVYHDTFVAVDEEGTEAAAATGVVVRAESAPVDPFELVVDRPFLFCIRDRETGAVLFLGRVVDAAAARLDD